MNFKKKDKAKTDDSLDIPPPPPIDSLGQESGTFSSPKSFQKTMGNNDNRICCFSTCFGICN